MRISANEEVSKIPINNSIVTNIKEFQLNKALQKEQYLLYAAI